MKKVWKIYDASLPGFAIAIILGLLTVRYSVILGVAEIALTVAFASWKYLYFKKKKSKLLYQVKTVSDELSFETGKAFESLAVACSVVEENGDIVWVNEKFIETFSLSDKDSYTNIEQIVKKNSLDKILLENGARIRVGNLYFSVYSSPINLENEIVFLLYFFDETKLRLTEKEFYESRPSIILTVLDNADEVFENFKESECASIFSDLDQMIDEWANSYGALCRKFSNARSMIFVEEKSLQKMISNKFEILDKVREYTFNGKLTDLTLSVGIGKADNIIEANDFARMAIDMAQSRGGDQVAIKHEEQYKFFGGVSSGFEKKNKVRTRLVAKSVAEFIKESSNVIVMGHRYSDFDSFGAAVGVAAIARRFEKDVRICVDRRNSLAYSLIDKYAEVGFEDELISPEKADDFIEKDTLLFVVDTHRQDFTECPSLLDRCEKAIVIDHHRKAVDYIEDTVLFYHMPNSSSACEMVAELSQYVDSRDVIDGIEATAMLSGIMLDTRNFIIRSGVRTFEAAAYLKKRGANTVECKKLFANDMDVFRHRNAIIDKSETYCSCAISVADPETENVRLVTAQAADEMINIDGVKASFVLYDNGDSVNISARSYGEINVQLIMEYLDGGGHQTMAACQLPHISAEEAEVLLKNAIDEYFSNL